MKSWLLKYMTKKEIKAMDKEAGFPCELTYEEVMVVFNKHSAKAYKRWEKKYIERSKEYWANHPLKLKQ